MNTSDEAIRQGLIEVCSQCADAVKALNLLIRAVEGRSLRLSGRLADERPGAGRVFLRENFLSVDCHKCGNHRYILTDLGLKLSQLAKVPTHDPESGVDLAHPPDFAVVEEGG